MKCIGINTLFIVPGRNRGVQTYVDHLIERLAARGEFRYVLFVSKANREHFRQFEGVELVECSIGGENRMLRVAYEQFVLQFLARRAGCRLLFFPGYLSPVWKLIPFVVTIPDTQFRDIPTLVPRSIRALYGTIVPRSVGKADEVITISEFSKSRILHHLKLAPEKVTVAPLAAGVSRIDGGAVGNDDCYEDSGLTLKGFDSARPFLISVSSANPHKNIDAMISAFVDANVAGDFQLVLLGASREDCPDNVFSTGFLPDAIRDALYRKAHGYIFASKYEGFGLPLLEAMEADIPIASSSAASLPEVGGDACLYFDPDDHQAMVSAIQRLCEDSDLRRELVEKGREQRGKFSWDRCAEVTESVFRRVLGGPM